MHRFRPATCLSVSPRGKEAKVQGDAALGESPFMVAR